MKKVLITGIAALSLVGFTACGGKKKDPKPPEVECTSSDQCTDPSKPFCNANGVCVADPNPGTDAGITDAGITDAGLDEDAGEQDAGEPFDCRKNGFACDLGQICNKTTGECDADTTPHTAQAGDECDADEFIEFCTADNKLAYCYYGSVTFVNCGAAGKTCRQLTDENWTNCYDSGAEDQCETVGEETAPQCYYEIDFGIYEYVATYKCMDTTSGVHVLQVNGADAEECEYNCVIGETGPECGKLDDNIGTTCDPDTDEEYCSENGAMYCGSYSKTWQVLNCAAYEGTICGILEGESNCFNECTAAQHESETEKQYCDDYYLDAYGVWTIGHYTCEDISGGKYGWIDSEEMDDVCNIGCDEDETAGTAACRPSGIADEGDDCNLAGMTEFEERCEGDLVVYCGSSNKVTVENCAAASPGTCKKFAGENYTFCFAESSACTADDDELNKCVDSMFASTAYHYVCTEMTDGTYYWYNDDEQDCGDALCDDAGEFCEEEEED